MKNTQLLISSVPNRPIH